MVLVAAPTLASCVSYEPAPVDISQVLAGLDALRWESPAGADRAENEGASPAQLASFAVTHNPALQAARAQIRVAQALLVEAGLLSDPTIGWDGMDALASQIVGGTTSSADFLSGFGLSIPLPRPGELDAQQGAARWRIEETRRRVVQAEWLLAREVYVSCEDLLGAERLLDQNQDLVKIAETTREYFDRAAAAGAATAIQANLAAGEMLAILAQRIRLEARLRDARHRLNALLGLPPSSGIPVVAAREDAAREDLGVEPEALVERSLSLRPDLAALLASYQAAEEEVRLEVARQFPLVAIGTGITLVPGLFTRFNRPAIDTAMVRREALRGEIEAQVHEVRREIYDAHAALEEARREAGFLESELLPNAEESLRLAIQAFDAGEVTLIEILTLQRAIVDARTRTTEARAELQRRRWRLRAASGTLLGDDSQAHPDEQETPER
jgi:outer membrane protein TolC